MAQDVRRLAALVALLAFETVACGDSFPVPSRETSGPSATTTTTPQSALPKPNLAGTYRLTIDVDDSCHDLPLVAKRRTYRATLEDTPYAYFTVRVVGEGFPTPTVMGDMFVGGPEKFRFSWNDFDVLGCEVPERLDDSTSLFLCGDGSASVTPSLISGSIDGYAWIEGVGKGPICDGSHHFAFEREPTEAANDGAHH